MSRRHLLVTSALPYANGPIHLGHMVEFIQTDIWVRFQRLRGHTVLYMGADDTHGTPIMLGAKREGLLPETLIAQVKERHEKDLHDFGIQMDLFYTTHSPENEALLLEIYQKCVDEHKIERRDIDQFYCESCDMFLPDRYLKGICPRCQSPDQYGDSCEVCSATYAPTDLLAPRCATCHSTPVLRTSEHYFFKLSECSSFLKAWIQSGHVRPEIQNKLMEWFTEGLQDWDISRDAPYFGFQIPDAANKYFYVWMDAPVGYMATTLKWCRDHGQDFDSIWRKGPYEIHHFIGKDILYFHALFWPAMLVTAGFKTPEAIHVHGFLTVNGEKMSKSRGTFIMARQYLDRLDPSYLRYYFAAKLNDAVEDLDFSWHDFVTRVNADLINKFINIASRIGAIVGKNWDGQLSDIDTAADPILEEIAGAGDEIAAYMDSLSYNKAMMRVMQLADKVNKYIHDSEPWNLVTQDPDKAQAVCTSALTALWRLSVYMKPVVPDVVAKIECFLGKDIVSWEAHGQSMAGCKIRPFEKILDRLKPQTD
ncbi:MAG: methionine--tRNA ligase [Candidatus Margulisiibacteriota bacterium]